MNSDGHIRELTAEDPLRPYEIALPELRDRFAEVEKYLAIERAQSIPVPPSEERPAKRSGGMSRFERALAETYR